MLSLQIIALPKIQQFKNSRAYLFYLAIGQSELIAESPVKVLGFKPEIDSQDWVATRVTHQLDQNGLTTRVDVEVKQKKIINNYLKFLY